MQASLLCFWDTPVYKFCAYSILYFSLHVSIFLKKIAKSLVFQTYIVYYFIDIIEDSEVKMQVYFVS